VIMYSIILYYSIWNPRSDRGVLDPLEMWKTMIEINRYANCSHCYTRQETIELVKKECAVNAHISILIQFHKLIVHQLYLGYPVVPDLLCYFHQYQYLLWQELDL
jgi:hypothetical protein